MAESSSAALRHPDPALPVLVVRQSGIGEARDDRGVRRGGGSYRPTRSGMTPIRVNLYAYLANDPLNLFDPTGQYECTGNRGQSAAARSAIARATTASRSSRVSEARRTALRQGIQRLGREGQRNGIAVRFAPRDDMRRTSSGAASADYNDRTRVSIMRGYPGNAARLNEVRYGEGRRDAGQALADVADIRRVAARQQWQVRGSRAFQKALSREWFPLYFLAWTACSG